jgi:hypothetical protein
VEQQLAGDVLDPDDPEGVAATGFIAAGPWQVTPESEADTWELLREMNRDHIARRQNDLRREARIASREMAAKLQLSAPEVLDISGESPATRKLYGLDRKVTEDSGRNCLIARRMLERGVRFVQLWSGAGNGFPRRNWDSHENLAKAAVLKDLKSRGLLDGTLVMWTTEFGRMPCSQGSKGRDHNPFACTVWLAGGIKGGVSYGASGEWSYKIAANPAYCYDVHATALHLLGIYTKLTYRRTARVVAQASAGDLTKRSCSFFTNLY